MPPTRSGSACVIGAGPNGLAAAIVLARAGLSVDVYEAQPEPGGGARTMELTLPGFLHDFGSAVHPLAIGSPFFRRCLWAITVSDGSTLQHRWRIRWMMAPL